MENAEAIPYCTVSQAEQFPSFADIVAILNNPDEKRISYVPVVKPVGGTLYLFRIDGGNSKWWWRCDQYSWQCGGSRKPISDTGLLKTYWGDSSIGQCLPHGRNKPGNARPHIRNAPLVIPKIVAKGTSGAAPKIIHDELTGEPAAPGLEAVSKPRSTEQVRNVLKAERRNNRISACAFYGTYELHHQMPDFIRYIRVAPNLNVRVISDEIMEHFNDTIAAASSSSPVQVLVDTTFMLGPFFVTPVLFRHSIFKGDPVVPLAFLFHERKWRYDHEEFLKFVFQSSKEFQHKSENVVFITDREFDFTELFPNTKHVHCWIHLLDNVRRWLDRRTSFSKEIKDSYVKDVRQLMKSRSSEKFGKRYAKYKWGTEERNPWHNDFVRYFDKHLKSVIETRVGRWIVEPLGLYNPYSGITTNAIESFNAVIKRWQQHKELPLDCCVLAIRRLVDSYARMIERGLYGIGDYHLKDNVLPRGLPHQCPKRDVISADQIIDFIRAEIHKPKMVDDYAKQPECEKKPDSVEVRAREILEKKQITFVPDQHCFVIQTEDGIETVTMESPEKCSCYGKKCCHIGAARLMIGKSAIRGVLKDSDRNVAERRRVRRRHLKPREGRKRPQRDAAIRKLFFSAETTKMTSESTPKKRRHLSDYSTDAASLPSPKRKRRTSESEVSGCSERSQESNASRKQTGFSKRLKLNTTAKKMTPVLEESIVAASIGDLVAEDPDAVDPELTVLLHELDEADLIETMNEAAADPMKAQQPKSRANVTDDKPPSTTPEAVQFSRSAVPKLDEGSLMKEATRLLLQQFPLYFQETGKRFQNLHPFVQLLQISGGRWICLKYNCTLVHVYSSFIIDWREHKPYDFSEDARAILLTLANTLGNLEKFSIIPMGKKYDTCDENSGLYAAAFAVDLCLGIDPIHLKYAEKEDLQHHLLQCLENKKFTPCPSTKRKSTKNWMAGCFNVTLYCYCRRPCLEPDLADLIQCDSCKNWFHKDCVDALAVAWEDPHYAWQCLTCADGASKEVVLPRWGGEVKKCSKTVALINTCTIDNFLAILHFANMKSEMSVYDQCIRSDGRYKLVGRMLRLMKDSKFAEAKWEWANELGMKAVDHDTMKNKQSINFFGGLHERWIDAFSDCFSFSSVCSNQSCDLGAITHSEKFNFTRFISGTGEKLQEVIHKQLSEYSNRCKDAAIETNGVICLNRECDGIRTYSAKNWIEVPPFLTIDVQGVACDVESLPRHLIVLERSYVLLGAVLYRPQHFVGVFISSTGDRVYYDGLQPNGIANRPFAGTELSCAMYLRE